MLTSYEQAELNSLQAKLALDRDYDHKILSVFAKRVQQLPLTKEEQSISASINDISQKDHHLYFSVSGRSYSLFLMS